MDRKFNEFPTKQQLDDLDMMQHPSRWPLDQALPIKRLRPSGPYWEFGMLVYLDEKETYLLVPDATIFEIIEMGDPRVVVNPVLEDILKQGWMVD